ncbi:ABC transporter ATP-binding protein [Paenibacillus sp. DMB20]|uniref:ABC transporter ATP-binding protein n=1 Tax=Paenibacillus sp. DMB20 TaxID=1642570 RepID=UPI000628165B|nr:ABC transporter ATP-binding protein [Paenibacillus sp. DMB20]KKO53338.1 ABC transporter [Paenibacillus sp. DMB20]
MNGDLLVLNGVSKRFGKHLAVSDITWTIGKGECAAITGGNGAGKSTLLHLIAGLSLPSQGTRIVYDKRMRIGYVPEKFAGLRFTPEEYLYHTARIQGLGKAAANRRVDGLVTLFRMREYAGRRMNGFSKGMLQKVNLMQAMLSLPGLLVLDEPLSGLDEPSQHDMISVLGEIKNQGTAIVMSVHEPLLTSALADRIVVMKQGRIIRDALHDRTEDTGCRLLFHGLPPDAMLQVERLDGFRYWLSRGTPSEIVIRREASDDILLFVLKAGGSVILLQPMDENVQVSPSQSRESKAVSG